MHGSVNIGSARIGPGGPLMVIAGPCVIESDEIITQTATEMKAICAELGLPFVFKSSFDKANRTSIDSFRGPGMEAGLKSLSAIRDSLGVPVITDVHDLSQVTPVAEAVDAIQVPAFLSRQTDLIVEAAKCGKPVNIKKGQFMSPWDAKNIVSKFNESGGKGRLMLTERGASFGYNNLVVDFRAFPVMRSFGVPIIYDLTHSLQLPGGQGGRSGGQREFASHMLRAAAAAGIDGVFMEVHPDPDKALCDGPNMVKLSDVKGMLSIAAEIHNLVNSKTK